MFFHIQIDQWWRSRSETEHDIKTLFHLFLIANTKFSHLFQLLCYRPQIIQRILRIIPVVIKTNSIPNEQKIYDIYDTYIILKFSFENATTNPVQ